MSRRTHRHECVPGRTFHYRIDRLARGARGAQRSLERIARDKSVVIEIAFALADCFFNVFEVLRRVARLNVAATRLAGFDFYNVGPQRGSSTQRINHHAVTLWSLEMIGARVVLFENRMMNYG